MNKLGIWTGTGADFSPDPVLLDTLIGKRLQARGFKGSRDIKKCLFATTDYEQALHYARDDRPDHVFTVEIMPGATVSWGIGASDFLFRLEDLYRDNFWNGEFTHHGKNCSTLMRDCGSEFSYLDVYLRHRRQKVAITHIVDSLLDRVEVKETVFTCQEALRHALDGHSGEIWVTGPHKLKATTGSPA